MIELSQKVFDVNLRSAKASKIDIIEIENLGHFMDDEKAEKIRHHITKNKTTTRQITNLRKFAPWTANMDLMSIHQTKFIPNSTYHIQTEMLMFDNTVALYRKEPEPFYQEITDKVFADSMRGLFASLRQVGQNLLMTADGSTLTKQYLPINHSFNNTPIIIYPSKDDGHLDTVFPRNKHGCLESYIDDILTHNDCHADILLAIPRLADGQKYCDIWKINRNTYSDDSGFLYEVMIFKGTDVTHAMGMASGNTSIVLTAEELLLRELIIRGGLTFQEASDRKQYQARFPVGYVPEEQYYI